MRGRLALLMIALMVPLSGCLSFLEDEPATVRPNGPAADVQDPGAIHVDGVAIHNHLSDGGGQDRITGHGGAALPYVIYEPLASSAMPDGSQPTFPIVVFVHGFGIAKEMWLCLPMGDPGQPPLPDDPCPFTNMLNRFAEAGFIAVAYDTRGFGQAGGQVTIAGEAEMADLDAVLDYVMDVFPHNGKVGVTGISYGGGHAMLAWDQNPRVTTAVAHQGWTDLYDALIPGHVPKATWGPLLLAEGTVTSGAQMHPMVYEWVANAAQRTDLTDIEADMDARSPQMLSTKPLLACFAMQDSLFTQAQDLMDRARGFTRVVVHHGGHGDIDAGCWDKTLDWFEHFLRGVDHNVERWAALETVDVAGGDAVAFQEFPRTRLMGYYLREPQLTTFAPSNMTFSVEQRLISNPLQEPQAIWDQTGLPNQAMPYSARQDPQAVFFESGDMGASMVLIGAPRLELTLPEGAPDQAFQVTAQLLAVDDEDSSIILSRGAYAHVPGVTPEIDGVVTLDFGYTKAELGPGSRLVLKVAANDVGWFLPLINGGDLPSSNYSVDFTSHSRLWVPFFEG